MLAQLKRLRSAGISAAAIAAVVVGFTFPGSMAAMAVSLLVFAAVWKLAGTGMAAYGNARILACLALIVNVWLLNPDRLVYLTAVVVYMGYIAVASNVRKALGVGFLNSYNLGVRRGTFVRLTQPAVVTRVGNGLAVLVAAVGFVPEGAAQTAADIALASVLAVFFGVVGARVLSALVQRQRDAHPVDAQVVEAVEDLEPRFAVHFAGTPGSEYQLTMWLPYFEAVGDPYIIIVRDAHLVPGIVAATDAPVIHAPAQSVLDRLLPDTVRACFYSNHAVKNTQLIKNGDYIHIQLMHGDSDKAISRSAASLVYDQVWVAGQAGVDRYHRHGVDIPNYKFRIIGRPQLSDIAVGERSEEDRASDGRTTVLYTPTWAGLNSDADYSSLSQAHGIVDALLERDVNVIFRTHPYTKVNPAYLRIANEVQEKLAGDRERTGKKHLYGAPAETEVTLTECVNRADVAISDISGTASDWLYGGRPFAMTDPRGYGDEYVEEFPIAKAAYRLRDDLSNLEEVLDELLVHDSLEGGRAKVRVYYLSDIPPEGLVRAFTEACRATYAKPVVKRALAAESGV